MDLSRRLFMAGAGVAATPLPRMAQAAGEKKILRVAIGGFPPEKGNAYANIQTPAIILNSGIFDALTKLNKDGSLSPSLATSWEAVDALTWRFKLRDDISFSNGNKFDAGAVVHAVEYLVAPGPATEGVRRDMPFLAGAKAIDKHTVEITTKVPIPYFPRYAAVLLIVEPEQWQKLGATAFSEKPVGTGPFLADSWEPGRILFSANRGSWRKPQIDGIEWLLLTDIPSRLQAYLSDRLDVVYQLPPEDFSTVKDYGGTVVRAGEASAAAVFFNFLNKPESPLADVRVRRALNMAVDRKSIVDVLLNGETPLSSQPTTKESFGYDPSIQPYPFDPAAAKKLLVEAGHPNGFGMTLETATGSTNSILIVQRIADDLARVGVKVEVRQKGVIQFLTDFVRGRFEADAFTLQWGSYPTLDSMQMTIMSSCRKTGPWYCNQEIQPVIDAAWIEADPKKALELRHQVMRFYHDDAPGLFLHENVSFIGLSPRTTGYDSVFGFIPYENIRLG
ncbi:MAG: ABC transporter substrate-binding protein, partial [Rhodospirillaceae bacterium]|nr:ABC transporter substrate-binding protein [Rhodospirillaceae bacterium]